MLNSLSEKVAEVHRSCVDDRMTNLSTLEKVANIESRMFSLLEGLESIPEERLETLKKIKDSEKRSRYDSVAVFCLLSLKDRKHLMKQHTDLF